MPMYVIRSTSTGRELATVMASDSNQARKKARDYGLGNDISVQQKNPTRRRRNPTTVYKIVNERSGRVKATTTDESKVSGLMRKHGVYTHYVETDTKKGNPSVAKGKFIKCKAVKFNRNGSVSIKK